MEGILIVIGMFLMWVLFSSLFDKIKDWNDKRHSVIERQRREEDEQRAEEERRYDSPEAVAKRKVRRAQEYRN